MNWFQKLKSSRIRTEGGSKRNVPEGLWNKCKGCDAVIYRPELERNFEVCLKCGYHDYISARNRLLAFLDVESDIEIAGNIESVDPLKFKDSKKYKDRLIAAQKKSNEKEALIVCSGKLKGLSVVAAAFDFSFMGGSMGSVVGERFVRAVHHCLEHQLPFICFTATGGARMQEGLFSLFQMARTSAALAKMKQASLPYIVVLTHPTTGGVSASLGMLGDINIAEPQALIGFAGPRVIEQTVKEKLPEGFQRSEFLLEHGAVDIIVDRRQMRDTVATLIKLLLNNYDNDVAVNAS